MAGRRIELPVLPAAPRERADAARNRLKILDAAARLFAEHGIDGVSMDAIAAEAGVGKGTLFRRFTDKSGLAAALLDERERQLQKGILAGPSPLGPGAPDAQRVHAFAEAYLDYLQEHVELIRLSETASRGARYRIGAYQFWHRHLRILLGDNFLAHSLLAALSADLAYTLRAEGRSWRWIRNGVRELTERIAPLD